MLTSSRTPVEAPRPRLQPLAKIPLFFDLRGRRALLAGGGAGAAWKAELLAAAGAEVLVAAEACGPEMLALADRQVQSGFGQVHLLGRAWLEGDFEECAVAVGDFESLPEAKSFRRAAKAAGVPVNTVDKPETCDFQFGTVVNRSPVVVGISTDGAAPILGQAIRQRIETALPRHLAEWGALAHALRQRVMGRLLPGNERRSFWEAFCQRAFGASPPPAADTAERWIDDAARQTSATGSVTLVGAGPGDPDLLTLKAMRALQSADVILFDDLVSVEVLELARREAKRMLVGKRGARESCRQEDINALMLKLAKQGKRVVRLKSGDPMIYGRAGEEIEALRAEGIAVTVVPGISAAQGLAASLGVSLTHRDCAQSVVFITGHSRQGDLPDTIDWTRSASPSVTTIVYMGARMATSICTELLAAGADPATPVVVGASLTGPGETLWHGPLDRLADGVATLPQGAPILIGVGKVFAEVKFRQGNARSLNDAAQVSGEAVMPRRAAIPMRAIRVQNLACAVAPSGATS